MVFWVIAVYVIIAAIDLPYLIKNKKTKELVVFSMIFVLGLVVGILVALQVPIPSVVKPIDELVKLLGLGYK